MNERFSLEERPTPLNLPAFLPQACARLLADFELRVVVELQEEYVSKAADEKPKKGKSAKSTVHRTASRSLDSQERDDAAPGAASSAVSPVRDKRDDHIALTAVYDAAGALVELALRRAPLVPRLLVKLLALCAPFHPALARLDLRRAALAGDALHDVARLLAVSQITELCLDDSPVAERNYHELLDGPARLRSLSLARCDLDDRDCATIAARLRFPHPAARSLRVLCLASNCIADAGAAKLADALRGNRALRHLNLADNRISDEGAARLFDSLVEFPLTYDELIARRRRLVDHLRLRDEIERKCRLELAAAERAFDEQSRGGKRRQTTVSRRRAVSLTRSAIATQAQAQAAELIGAYSDPFGADETVSRDGYAYSAGNATLCALNLAYNELGYPSVARLAAVLRYQAARAAAGWEGPGLLLARLDGNALPVSCAELRAAESLLERALASQVDRPLKSKPEKATGKAKSK